jgi:CIC family chloride channel protein
MAGMAFGTLVHDAFGPTVGPPALYAIVAMGGVFAAAAQAPLTAIASVIEMTGNFTLTLPVMLTCGIASAVSKHLSYGSVYTTKLLRRGIDIERPKTTNMLQTLTVADVMHPIGQLDQGVQLLHPQAGHAHDLVATDEEWENLIGPLTDIGKPQELFPDETLEQALRQLALYGRAGLPVLSPDRDRLTGWITRDNVLHALAQSVESSNRNMERGAVAADFGADDPEAQAHTPSTPLSGYEIVEMVVGPESPAVGRRISDVPWPPGCVVAAVTNDHEIVPLHSDTELAPGERVVLLVPAPPDSAERPLPTVSL